eukprot:scaffold10.g2249.t1
MAQQAPPSSTEAEGGGGLEGPERSESLSVTFASAESIGDDLEDLLGEATVGLAVHSGCRPTNDDRHTAFSHRLAGGRRASSLAIFDGHHGSLVAELLCSALPGVLKEQLDQSPYDIMAAQRAAIRVLDDLAYEKHARGEIATGGSTVLLLTLADDTLFTANVGDCKALLSVGPAGTVAGAAAALNTCHNPNIPAERARFEAAGLGVASDHMSGCDLNVCRTLGDYDLGAPLKWRDARGEPAGPMTPEPEISARPIDPNDEFMIAASDGLWDYWSPDSSVLIDTRRQLRMLNNDAQSLADWLVNEAAERQRRILHESSRGDNITVAVLRLRRLPKLTKKFGSSRLNLASRRGLAGEPEASPLATLGGDGAAPQSET